MFDLSPLVIKLILSGVAVLIVGAAYFYVTGLQNKIEDLKTENTVLIDDNKELKETIDLSNQFQEIIVKVDAIGNEEREVNRKQRDKQLQQIDNSVREGQDKPVGPLLKEFFNAK